MILVDTSVWIDHLHTVEPALVALLEQSEACTHPMVIGEIALGSLRDRAEVLRLLGNLPMVETATSNEILRLIEFQKLHGTGLSLVDAHLLAATKLTSDTLLWTRDKRLLSAARTLGVAWDAASAPEG